MAWTPTRNQIGYGIKPIVWLIVLSPAAWLAWGAWLSTTGDSSVLGGDPQKTFIKVSGETAIRALLAALLLGSLRDLARLTWMIQLRRLLGLTAFFWGLVHLVCFAIFELELDPSRLLKEVVDNPYITAGAASLLVMLPLAITSTNGWRRRLGKRWNTLHKLVYFAAFAACVHIIWQVRSDWSEALLYSGCFALIAAQRIWTAYNKRNKKVAPSSA